jgi:ATP-dependent DNA helicase RecG
MALLINIDDILQNRSVERERVEYKEGWNPEDVLHTLCGFANDFHNLGGGYLFVGVAEENGRPVLPPKGLDPNVLDALQKEILNLGYKIQPFYHPIIEPCVVDGVHILVMRAPGGQNRPYKAPVSLSKDNARFEYYIRKGSSTVMARGDDERELMSLAAQIPFDDRMNHRASLSDLKLTLIKAHLRDAGSALCEESENLTFKEVCERMSLLDGPSEHLLPRNVGLMFFNERPGSFFPQTQIDIVVFPQGPSGKMLIEKTFHGPISQMLRDALRYLNTAVLREYVVKIPTRAEADRFFNYPYAAVEEILVNAVYHRSYEEREPIEVRVLQEQITITSYPGPDRSISLENLSQGVFVARRYRNRRIGEFLKELHLTEGRGTGIPTAIRAMQENGSPRPIFETDADRTFFTAVLPINPEVSSSSLQATPQATAYEEDMLNRIAPLRKLLRGTRTALLLDELQHRKRVTTSDIAELLRVTQITARRYLLLLESAGLIKEHSRSKYDPTAYWTITEEAWWVDERRR